MNLWGWVLAYVVGFSLLQVLIYRYLSGRDEGGANARSGERALERTTPRGEQWPSEGGSTVGEPPQGADPLSTSGELDPRDARSTPQGPQGRHCPRCGALNDAAGAFTYCRNCIRPLG